MSRTSGEVHRLADAILRRIVTGQYSAGLRLPAETDLAEEFDCGRSTVREALSQLASMGVVRSRRGSGAMVLDFRKEGTPALLPAFVEAGNFDRPPAIIAAELLRIRTQMACEAVRLAARYAAPEDLADARERLRRAPALETSPLEHAANELELYRALVAASGIWPAVWLVNSFWAPLGEVHRLLAPAMGRVREDFQPTMERLLAHIEARQESSAVELVQSWFAEVDRQLVALIEQAVVAVGPQARRASAARPASAAPSPSRGEAGSGRRSTTPT